MLTPAQERYLAALPDDEVVRISPFNPLAIEVVNEIVKKIEEQLPSVEIRHIGATALGLSGKGDLDLDILCTRDDFEKSLSTLRALFGPTEYKHEYSVRWFFTYKGFPVEIYLSDPSVQSTHEELMIFEKLRDNPALKSQYEKFKEEGNGLSMREYQRRKFEWYNQVLGLSVDP